MKRVKSIICLMTCCMVALVASAQKTTIKNLKLKDDLTKSVPVVVEDTITPDTTMVRVAGYDKPLTSRRETFFVTNHTQDYISKLQIELNYYDESGRQLHSVTRWVNCSIPVGETRQLYIPSWDKQFSFYYYKSSRPRRQSTPFKVTHRILKVTTPAKQHFTKKL